MAFCNSCGASLTDGTRFCNKCGAPVSAVPVPTVASTPAPAPTGGSSALKIILIVFAVIVVIGVIGVATIGIIGYRIAKSSHVTQHGDKVKVDTPFGTLSANDPEQTAKDLGIDIYPGAQVQKEGTVSVTFGSIHTVTAKFETSDAVDKVCDFYKERFPSAVVTTSEQNHCTINSNDAKNSVTINADGDGTTTRFQITSVKKSS